MTLPKLTIGIEEEYQVIDPDSRDLPSYVQEFLDQGHIVQEFHPLPEIAGNYPLVGCWLFASRAGGMCIREDRTLVTGKEANFVPHVILD